jgi:hypothetical protein
MVLLCLEKKKHNSGGHVGIKGKREKRKEKSEREKKKEKRA